MRPPRGLPALTPRLLAAPGQESAGDDGSPKPGGGNPRYLVWAGGNPRARWLPAQAPGARGMGREGLSTCGPDRPPPASPPLSPSKPPFPIYPTPWCVGVCFNPNGSVNSTLVWRFPPPQPLELVPERLRHHASIISSFSRLSKGIFLFLVKLGPQITVFYVYREHVLGITNLLSTLGRMWGSCHLC